MLLKSFSTNPNEQNQQRINIESALSNFINEFNEKPQINHQRLDAMIEACEEYICSLPWKDNREYFFFAAVDKKAAFQSLFPNAEAVFELQQSLVNYRFLPEAPSLAKSRWGLLRELLNPNASKGQLTEGRRLQASQWLEFKYQGNFEAYRWMLNIPNYHLIGLGEVIKSRTRKGIGMQNIFYATPAEQETFLTSFAPASRLLLDRNKQLVDTSQKRLALRRPGMTVYVLTSRGLCVFPDDNEDKYQAHIRHSSMPGGRPVMCAGMIKVKDGVIIEINNDSRHYQPSEKNFKKLVDFLKLNQVAVNAIKLDFIDFSAAKYRYDF